MPGHRAAYEWFLEKSKDTSGLVLQLSEFEWVLRTNYFFHRHIEPIMDFLTGIAESFETKQLVIRSYKSEGEDVDKDTLYARFKGGKFPNTALELNLPFLKPNPYLIINGAKATSDSIWMDLEAMSQSDEYRAWKENALPAIEKQAGNSLFDEGVQLRTEEREIWFEATATSEDILAAAQAVQDSYSATLRMNQLYKERVSGLAQKILQSG